VREYLSFRAQIKRVARRERKAAVERSLEQAAVKDVAETPISHLSKGYRQRVALADALVASPPLLILDEPTAGLDPNQIVEARRLIRELGRTHTILLSTHILPEVEAVCDRALVIARGRLVGEGTIEELKARRRAGSLEIVVRGDEEKVMAALSGVSGVKARRAAGIGGGNGLVRLSLELDDAATPGDVAEHAVAALAGSGVGVRRVVEAQASLEEVFRELTESEPAPSPAAEDPGAPDPAAEGGEA
jgi:ABC-2 type transport system ATP-binding protein